MTEPVHLVCLEKGCRFLADLLPDRLCPNCGVEMVSEERFLSRMRPKPVEEDSDLPPEAREAARDPGSHIGDFVLINVLGEGGAGVVYRAWQRKLRRFVAIKFLSSPTPETLRRFEGEAQLGAQLRHPNIAGVHEVGEQDGKHYIVMDFIDGFPIGMASLSIQAIAEVFIKVCRAMAFAHARSIIHRDLKPANILYENNGEPSITDFGLAKVLLDDVDLMKSQGIKGTPAYMSPEQARGRDDEVDQKSDIFGLGATLYSLVTGRPPFDGENAAVILHQVGSQDPVLPSRENKMVPRELEAIIMKALEKERSLRYETADEMAEDLERFLADEPVIARIRGPVERFGRWARKNPWPLVTAASLLIAFVGMLILQFLPGAGKPHSPEKPTVAGRDGKWKSRFDEVTAKIAFREFEATSPELIGKTRNLLSEVPEPLLPKVRSWFEKQSREVPPKVWPADLWVARQPEARRIRQWCSMVLSLLRGLGPSFEPTRRACRDSLLRFAPVEDYRGKVSIRFLIWPYARLKSFRVEDRWIIRDGEILGDGIRVPGGSLYTPLEMQEVEIGDYTLVFSHPDLGELEFRFPGDLLKNGKTYFCSGSLSDPDSLSIQAVP